MTDTSEIVKRLRAPLPVIVKRDFNTAYGYDDWDIDRIEAERKEAADRLEALEAENKRLKEALLPFANAGTMTFMSDGLVDVKLFIADILAARSALKGET